MSEGIEFVELDSITGYDFTHTPTYIQGFYAVALDGSGIGIYELTGTGEIILKHMTKNADCKDLTTDGTYLYSAETGGIASWSINNNTGELTLINFETTLGSSSYIWYFEDHDVVLAGHGGNGLGVYTTSSGSTTLDCSDDQGGTYRSVRGWGDLIWVANASEGLQSYSYTGAGSLTYLSHNDPGGLYYGLHMYSFDEVGADDKNLPIGSPPYYLLAECPNVGVRVFQDDGFGNISLIQTYSDFRVLYASKFNNKIVLDRSSSETRLFELSWNSGTNLLDFNQVWETDETISYLYMTSVEDNATLAIATGEFSGVDSFIIYYVDDANLSARDTFNIVGGGELIRLHMPEWAGESRDVSKNVEVFDFWNNTLSTVDTGKNSEPVTLKGWETISGMNEGICMDSFCMSCLCFSQKLTSRFEAINELMDNNYPVKIEGLGDCMDGIYVISNFSYKTVKGTPYKLEWVLELEYKEDLS